MTQIAEGFFDKVKKWWLLHYKCVFVLLIFIIIVLLIGWIADRVSNSSKYLSVASVVVSIVLSIVVIGYTVLQGIVACGNADRIERLLERLGEKVEAIHEKVDKITDFNKTSEMSVGTDDQTAASVKEVGKGDLFLSLEATSNLTRMFALYLLRSHRLDNFLPVEGFVEIVTPLAKMPQTELSSYVYGIVHGMACGLKGLLQIREESDVYLCKCPSGFESHLSAIRNGLIRRVPEAKEYIERIESFDDSSVYPNKVPLDTPPTNTE
jgi:hypothetical protein